MLVLVVFPEGKLFKDTKLLIVIGLTIVHAVYLITSIVTYQLSELIGTILSYQNVSSIDIISHHKILVLTGLLGKSVFNPTLNFQAKKNCFDH